MFVRLFIVGTFVGLIALASFEMKVLWPLVGSSTQTLQARKLGQVDLATPERRARLQGLAYDDADAAIWVADTEPTPRLVVLDIDGAQLAVLPGTLGSGISADRGGILAVDPATAKVSRIARDGTTTTWKPADGITSPRGVARAGPDSVAIAETGRGVVLYFRDGGERLDVVGLDSSGLPELLEPRYPIIDADGRLYVSDRKGRVVRFAHGQIETVFNTRDRAAAVLSDPQQTALDVKGRLWVADTVAGRVWVFDPDGNLVAVWRPVEAPHPVALLIVGERIYVTDQDKPILYWFELPQFD